MIRTVKAESDRLETQIGKTDIDACGQRARHNLCASVDCASDHRGPSAPVFQRPKTKTACASSRVDKRNSPPIAQSRLSSGSICPSRDKLAAKHEQRERGKDELDDHVDGSYKEWVGEIVVLRREPAHRVAMSVYRTGNRQLSRRSIYSHPFVIDRDQRREEVC